MWKYISQTNIFSGERPERPYLAADGAASTTGQWPDIHVVIAYLKKISEDFRGLCGRHDVVTNDK